MTDPADSASLRPQQFHWKVVLTCLLLTSCLLTSCGGGGGGTNPPPNNPDFTVAVSPSSATLLPGTSADISVSITATHGFASTVAVTSSTTPADVSVSPSSLSVAPGTSQSFHFTAAESATFGNFQVTITAASGSLNHSKSVAFKIEAAPTTNGHAFTTRYVRTDAYTAHGFWLNSHWVVFHAATNRFFVSDPETNKIDVLDASTQSRIASIQVPGAFGIDDSADHTTIWVGTLLGDVYAVDPVRMAVRRRYLATQIGPFGYKAITALGLNDGRVALLGEQGGIPSVDGSPGFALWDPEANTTTFYASDYGMVGMPGLPVIELCPSGNIGAFERNSERNRIYIGSIFSDSTICMLDTDTGNSEFRIANGMSYKFTVSPDGKYLVMPQIYDKVVVYDAHTFVEVRSFPVKGDISSASGLTFGLDPNLLLVPHDAMVFAYDLRTGQEVGWMPNIYVPNQAGGFTVGPASSPYYRAASNSNILVGPAPEGAGFLDLSQLRTTPVGTLHTNGYLVPATGPRNGNTQTVWSGTNGTLSEVYFGPRKAQSSSRTSNGQIQATTPIGAPGPVDVYAFTTDGGMQLIPEGFSYGPSILQVTTNFSSEQGGDGLVFGYGFGPFSTEIPSGLSIAVNGHDAPIKAFHWNASGTGSPVAPIQAIEFGIPPGNVGAADVTVTTEFGSIEEQQAIEYLPPVKTYPRLGAVLAQGIYDRHRSLYYFTDIHAIQVFSTTSGWLAPIQIPASQELWGLALSPDGTKLAVSDPAANAIYLLNPSLPSSIRTFGLPVPTSGVTTGPGGVAVSDQGMIYYTTFVFGGTGYDGFFKLDSTTGNVKNYGLGAPGYAYDDVYLRTIISEDNARVYFNELGYVFYIDTLTDQVTSATVFPGCCYGDYDLALSSNQTSFGATGYVYDSELNARAYLVLNSRENKGVSYLYGNKLSPDGSLLFQPTTNGIDVFDGKLGRLRMRISLPIALTATYDTLVSNGRDNSLIAITGDRGDGIAVIDLNSLPLPPPLSYMTTSRIRNTLGVRAQPPRKQVAADEKKKSGTFRSRLGVHIPTKKIVRIPK